ncbi:TrmH family RNA methyltransferase [Myroides guanonis]|uniref:RNA methyltransferase, TrmH family n=1 Tax=Myroides guanonis TaxID=1150112 RepID=A0A1I3NMP8_9FLAO|nr:RNA methyltransferase [Myroides guanonis]SFJ10618.1 RNA methyltransferase, TrmH family [Myroides guanonis]
MVTKNQIKRIKSLHQKKYRKEFNLFIAEGAKVVQELLNSNFKLEHIYVTENLPFNVESDKISVISESDLKKISALSTANNCLAVFETPIEKRVEFSDWVIALDDIRDPGNLGTIIRLCDWFGIEHLICSSQTVDVYNPKVVQATMGSLSRVNVVYGDLATQIRESKVEHVYGTFMDGDNIYQTSVQEHKGIVVMGNEANGISDEIERLVTRRISIPRFGNTQQTESLNVAMATSIILSELRRS